ILKEIDPNNIFALKAIADLEMRRSDHGAAAAALEKILAAVAGEDRMEVARQLAAIYEGPLDDVRGAIRVLDIVHQGDSEDFDAIARLQRLAEKIEDWPRVALLMSKLIEVEGDDEEASEMTRNLAVLYATKMDKGDEALGVLQERADQGDTICQQ